MNRNKEKKSEDFASKYAVTFNSNNYKTIITLNFFTFRV
jgi:hypothetical protein